MKERGASESVVGEVAKGLVQAVLVSEGGQGGGECAVGGGEGDAVNERVECGRAVKCPGLTDASQKESSGPHREP